MGAKTKPGDRVRIVIEGEWVDEAPARYGIQETGRLYRSHADDTVKIKKVEPPVETFKPGDVVRDKRNDSLWAVATDGYLRFGGEGYRVIQSDTMIFTSKNYERVTVN